MFRFCCFPVFHAANVGVVNFHSLWCVLGPLHFLFMHHNFLNEEPQQLRRQRLNVRVPLRFVEEGCRIAYRFFQPMYFRFSLRERFCQFCLFIGVTGREQLELFCRDTSQHTVLIELLKNRIQFGFALLHGRFLFFQSADLFLEFRGLLTV